MIFRHTWEKVLSGEKTETRRLIGPRDVDCTDYFPSAVMTDMCRIKYQVGKFYAVQPGRGKPGVAQIQMLDIYAEDVRSITENHVKAEGYENAMYFFSTWLSMHDPSIQLKACRGQSWDLIVNRKLEYWDATLEHVRDLMKARPAERYQAWALTFQLVQS